jgi:hypothetical protein
MNIPTAFPCEIQLTDQDVYVSAGMSLRDYFAAKALISPVCLDLSLTNNWDNQRRSEWAYKQADAMMEARK